MPFSPRDKDSIIEAINKSDVVINLIGKNYETKHIVPTRRADGSLSRINFDFEEVNVTIPETLAQLSKECGVKTFIHMSALAADANSTSKWARTKAQGEVAVRNKFSDAVSTLFCVLIAIFNRILPFFQIIIKPAPIFGAEDRLLNWIGETINRLDFFPLLNSGANVIQPVYSVDVAKAIMQIIYVSTSDR